MRRCLLFVARRASAAAGLRGLAALAILLAIASLVTSCAPSSDEPTGWSYNGGFEDFLGDFFDGWYRSTTSGGMGKGVAVEYSPDAHTGRTAVRLKSTGESGAILNTMPGHYMSVLKGRASFWYKAVSSACGGQNLIFYIIPMTADGIEGGGARTCFTVPGKHVGDGKWHKAEIGFDYLQNPGVTHTIVAPRVNDGSAVGQGEWLIDDIMVTREDYWPRPQLVIRGVAPSKAIITNPAEPVTIRCTVANIGRLAVSGVQVDIEAVRVSGAHRAELGSGHLAVGDLAAGGSKTVAWRCRCPARGWLALEARAAGRYTEPETGRVKRTPKVAGSAWAPVRTRFASMPRQIASAGRCGRGSLILGDGARRIMLDQEEEPPILRFFVRDGKWREVARSPWLVRVGSDGGAVHSFVPTSMQAHFIDGVLRIECRTDAGLSGAAGWKAVIDLGYDSAAGVFDACCRARPAGKTGLRLLEFPTLLVGEGTTGSRKSSAIFPGLEFLKGGERSSGTSYTKSPPSDRWSPHPYRVTIPLMAVATGQAAVGIAWDPLARWDGEHRYLTPLFASPNFLDGQSNHKLALFAPSVPDFVPENATEASRPAEVDGDVTIRAKIILEPKADALDLVKIWAGRIAGNLSPPAAPRSYQDELKLCAQAFLETAWNEKSVGWESAWRSYARADPGILLAALRMSREVQDAELANRIRAVAQRVIRAHGKKLRDLNLSFAAGGIIESISALRLQAVALMKEQGPEGQWTFQPDEEHSPLGRRGDTTVGICATNALPVLQYAEVTGDPQAIAAATRALKYMDRFVVPAGAQVWECPLHAPDILSSAKAVQAYVAGYRITGNRHYAQKAKYWAWTGVPFVYLWAPPERPVMKGASIPTFGATFFTWSWTSRPVQWNGLAYASALLDLAPHDPTYDWRSVAEAIILSAMRQQAVDGPNLGLFPDAWHLIPNAPAYPWLSPENILTDLWKLRGKEWISTSRPLGGRPGTRVTLPPGAACDMAKGGLRIGFRYRPLLGSDYILVTGARRPARVTVGATKALAETADLSRVGSGWTYDSERKWLVVKVTHAGRASVMIAEPNP